MHDCHVGKHYWTKFLFTIFIVFIAVFSISLIVTITFGSCLMIASQET